MLEMSGEARLKKARGTELSFFEILLNFATRFQGFVV